MPFRHENGADAAVIPALFQNLGSQTCRLKRYYKVPQHVFSGHCFIRRLCCFSACTKLPEKIRTLYAIASLTPQRDRALQTGWSSCCSLQGSTPSRELSIEFRRVIVAPSAAAGADT